MAKSAKAVKSALTKEPAAPSASFTLPAGFKAVRAVTLPAIVIKREGENRILRIEDKMHESTTKGASEKQKDMGPATVCPVTDVQTGEMGTFVVPSVVKGNLEESYPDDGYVGKIFSITNRGKRQGKRYNDFMVVEVAAE